MPARQTQAQQQRQTPGTEDRRTLDAPGLGGPALPRDPQATMRAKGSVGQATAAHTSSDQAALL